LQQLIAKFESEIKVIETNSIQKSIAAIEQSLASEQEKLSKLLSGESQSL